MIVNKLREWVDCVTSESIDKQRSFRPLHMTIRGSAGSGKSFLIKTAVNVVRKVFGFNDVACVVAPTGAAAYNVGGQTVHRRMHINPHHPAKKPSAEAVKHLRLKNKHILLLVYDERSMLTCDVVGASERNISLSTHGGDHSSKIFGGIPVVLFVGDDYQLPPPTNVQKGAFDTMKKKASLSQQKLDTAAYGAYLFHEVSKVCVQLDKIERQDSSEDDFRSILQRVRVGQATSADACTLLTLHTNRLPTWFVDKVASDPQTIFLFAKKAPRDEHNYSNLARMSNKGNPVAIIRTQYTSVFTGSNRKSTHFKKDGVPQSVPLCRGAKVCLCGRNFEPDWGLYNNAVGTVQEIVYVHGKSPNNDDHPLYIVVYFPQYKGPIWDPKNPKVRKLI